MAKIYYPSTGVATPCGPYEVSAPVNPGGTPSVGNAWSPTDGSYTGAPIITKTYQWRWGDTLAAVSGVTTASYTPVSGDNGHTLQRGETVSSGGYSLGPIWTTATAAVVTTYPVNSVLPAITGTAQVGQTLTVSNGTWSNSPTSYAYQWKSGGTNVGTNANTYVPVTGDIGNTITCVVTATNANGSAAATAAATAAVVAAGTPAPANTVLPAITGTAQVGQTLTVSNGTWTNTPTSYAYQWKRGATNVGTNANTYVPVSGDVGSAITCVVTATNAGGSTPATSGATASVVAATPVNTVLPVITGVAQVGVVLTASTGTWNNSPTSYAYQWKSNGSNVGTNSTTYTPVTGDIGHTITVDVTATNTGGSATATSSATAAVIAASGGTLVHTQLSTYAPTTTGTLTITVPTVNIGTAASDTYILVKVAAYMSGENTLTARHDGTSLPRLAGSSNPLPSGFNTDLQVFGALLTGGGNVVLDVTATDPSSSGSPFLSAVIEVVKITGSAAISLAASSLTPSGGGKTDTTGASGLLTDSAMTVPSGGMMEILVSTSGPLGTGETWGSGLAGDATDYLADAATSLAAYFAHSTTTGSVTPSWTSPLGYGNAAMLSLVFQP